MMCERCSHSRRVWHTMLPAVKEPRRVSDEKSSCLLDCCHQRCGLMRWGRMRWASSSHARASTSAQSKKKWSPIFPSVNLLAPNRHLLTPLAVCCSPLQECFPQKSGYCEKDRRAKILSSPRSSPESETEERQLAHTADTTPRYW